MKQPLRLAALLLVCTLLFSSCFLPEKILAGDGTLATDAPQPNNPDPTPGTPSDPPTNEEQKPSPAPPPEGGTENEDENENEGGNENDGGDEGGNENPTPHIHTEFDADDKALWMQYIGVIIPFLPNDSYGIEGYYDVDDYENGLNFYTLGNTEAEFDAYRALFSDYELIDTYTDTYGDTWYTYQKDDVVVDLAYYVYEGESYVEVYVYSDLSSDVGDGGEGGGDQGGDETPTTHIHTEFDADDKALWLQYIGVIIPFLPNDSYGIEGYYDVDDYENGLNFYTLGNTEAEFDAYRALFSDYELIDTYTDTYGDTWYTYQKDDVVVDLAYYVYEGESYVEVYVYSDLSSDGGEGGDGREDDENDPPQENGNLITNAGAGLPSDPDGIYDIDFTDGQYMQNVTQQSTYLDGCPTTDSPAVLVIPVEFSDATAESRGYTLDALQSVLTAPLGSIPYYSLSEYYEAASYGRLTLDITLADAWFRPKYNSTYYKNATMDYFGDEIAIGDQLILDEALAYLATVMDLSRFDSDNNGHIDAVILVNTLDVDTDPDGDVFHWAYRYWNLYADDEGYYYEYDGVSANDYMWLSYQFMFETSDGFGNLIIDPNAPINSYTFVHEFGHVLGAEDYYDVAGKRTPLGGYDVMDSMAGDHNPFTKIHFGWITSSRLVVTDTAVTLTLEAFGESGDTLILANNWDPALGAYQEYYVIVYYTNDGLNGGQGGYFEEEGLLVYHVNASLTPSEYDGEISYDIYNTNTDPSDEYGTENNLIEFVTDAQGGYVYTRGERLPTVTDDTGDLLGYTFVVNSINENGATLTVSKLG